MPLAWRIVQPVHAASAFSGEGAFLYGGRWNSPGTRVVYAGGSLALAALEMLVHLRADDPVVYVTFRVTFDPALVETLDPRALPSDWRQDPAPPETKAVGDAWARAGRSVILAVPSAVVPAETNYLLNPAHPDFAGIKVGPAEPFTFDPRLLKTPTPPAKGA